MSLKSVALEMFRKNNREAKLDFYNRMTDSIAEYKNAIDEASDTWIRNAIACDDAPDNNTGKRLYHKKRCKALIAMDRAQLQAAHLFEMDKIMNESLYNNQIQTADIEKSVWFSGSANTPAHY